MQLQRVGTHKTSIVHKNGVLSVTYHSTEVVRVTGHYITLATGGWKTNTTKARMNQTSNEFDLGYRVYQKAGEWFVEFRSVVIPFEGDELTLVK